MRDITIKKRNKGVACLVNKQTSLLSMCLHDRREAAWFPCAGFLKAAEGTEQDFINALNTKVYKVEDL